MDTKQKNQKTLSANPISWSFSEYPNPISLMNRTSKNNAVWAEAALSLFEPHLKTQKKICWASPASGKPGAIPRHYSKEIRFSGFQN